MPRSKEAIVTFKAEPSLVEALQGIPNRSAFIRSAILAALNHLCPLCQGTGILSPEQKTHWQAFSVGHRVQECTECHEFHLVCSRDTATNPHD